MASDWLGHDRDHLWAQIEFEEKCIVHSAVEGVAEQHAFAETEVAELASEAIQTDASSDATATAQPFAVYAI